MPDSRVTVWIQHFKDRPALMLQWLDPDTGKRKSQSARTDDEKVAEQRRADLESDLNHGRHASAERMSWEAFRDRFEDEYLPNSRPGTVKIFRLVLDDFETICTLRQLRSITPRTISAFVSGLRKKKGRCGNVTMGAYTIAVRLNFLHIVLNWAVDQSLLTKCPTFPEVKVPQKYPQPVAEETVDRLLDKAPTEDLRVFMLCGWLAGLRLAETFALEWEPTDKAPWIDFTRKRIWLPADFVKAVKDQWVPLDPKLSKALQQLPRRGKKVFRILGKLGKPLIESSVSALVSLLAQQAGVKLTMKALRKGFGCRYAAKVSTHVLQRLMRHADIETTMAYYANIDTAVEEAILGPQRNSLRNSGAASKPDESDIDDVSCLLESDSE